MTLKQDYSESHNKQWKYTLMLTDDSAQTTAQSRGANLPISGNAQDSATILCLKKRANFGKL